MAEYHVGCGAFDIYAGLLNKDGNTWKRKTPVTMECLKAVAQYLLDHDFHFYFKDQGIQMVMKVMEVKE